MNWCHPTNLIGFLFCMWQSACSRTKEGRRLDSYLWFEVTNEVGTWAERGAVGQGPLQSVHLHHGAHLAATCLPACCQQVETGGGGCREAAKGTEVQLDYCWCRMQTTRLGCSAVRMCRCCKAGEPFLLKGAVNLTYRDRPFSEAIGVHSERQFWT